MVALLATASVLHAVQARGWAWALVLVVAVSGVGFVAEIVGIATGIPFGGYFYADRLGPAVLGVPLVIPVAWLAGFYPVWCATRYVVSRSTVAPRWRPATRIVTASVGMVGWDLYLDTQMVTDGQWVWTSGSPGLPGLPSIPVTNYLGWFVIALLMAVVVEVVGGRVGTGTSARRSVSDAAPTVLFLWTWLGSALAHAVFLDGDELKFSAIYGFVGMGVVGIPLVMYRLRNAPVAAPA